MLNTKVILNVGKTRSGTTWAFNVIKKILEKKSKNFYSLYLNVKEIDKLLNYLKNNNCEYLIIKVHSMEVAKIFGDYFSDKESLIVVASIRDPLTNTLSNLRVNKAPKLADDKYETLLKEKLKLLDIYLTKFEKFLSKSKRLLVIHESNIRIRDRSVSVINYLFEVLGIPKVSVQEINDIADEFSIKGVKRKINKDFSYSKEKTHDLFDLSSHWHSDHVKLDDYKIPKLSNDTKTIVNLLNSKTDLILQKNKDQLYPKNTQGLSTKDLKIILLEIKQYLRWRNKIKRIKKIKYIFGLIIAIGFFSLAFFLLII